MGRSLSILVDRGPYGSLQPAEAIRHAQGAVGKGWEVVLALTGDAVLTALAGQAPPPGEWVPLSRALAELLEAGEGRAAVLVEAEALEARRVPQGDLVPGSRAVALREIARALARVERALVF